MASIRRVPSAANNALPYHNTTRHHSHSSTSSSSSSSSSSFSSPPSDSFLAGRPLSRAKPPPPQHNPCKRYLLRLLLFFLFGFLFGLYPFPELDDLALQPPPSAISTTTAANNNLPRRDLSALLRSRGGEIEIVRFDGDQRWFSKVDPPPPDPTPQTKLLIVVTPTYNRAFQGYYLSRLGQNLRLVQPPLLWVVVEMSAASMETAEILMDTGVMYRHLVCKKNMTNIKDRGVHQRNTALEHIERHRLDGIVYFADDDNIYSLELFQRLRAIWRFGVWPVAMLSQNKNKAMLEGPVCNGSQVIGWHTNEKSKRLRRFHVDMSGFAFNSTILWDPRRWHRPNSYAIRQLDSVKEGFQETTFIEQIVEDESQMEGLPNGCSRIMNWHLHLEARDLVYPKGWQLSGNLDAIIRLM